MSENNAEVGKLRRGAHVEKIMGYLFPGIVKSVFLTEAGRMRCVVECTVPGCEGMLHVFNPDQLRIVPAEKKARQGGHRAQVKTGTPNPERSEPVNSQDSTATEKLLYSIKEFTEVTGIGHTNVYKQIALGRLTAKKIGKRTAITAAELKRWLEALPDHEPKP